MTTRQFTRCLREARMHLGEAADCVIEAHQSGRYSYGRNWSLARVLDQLALLEADVTDAIAAESPRRAKR